MGTKEGGLAAAKTLKQKFGGNFYSVIGAMGGRAGSMSKGFASQGICNCDLIQGEHKTAQCRGKLGGLKSRRTGVKNGERKSE